MNDEALRHVFGEFRRNPPATQKAIDEFESETGIRLPLDYVRFLLWANGGNGEVGDAHVGLWRVEDIARLNEGYGAGPDLLLFGSDGGGEGVAFDRRVTPSCVVLVPFIGISTTTPIALAPSFAEFIVGVSGRGWFGKA